ncbi:MAG: hypothetical protein M1814_000483 [Vezdaea aestivalis]|nr:MAG: hypothetical protein M1814_000483 [Vezdaea aestivalis]
MATTSTSTPWFGIQDGKVIKITGSCTTQNGTLLDVSRTIVSLGELTCSVCAKAIGPGDCLLRNPTNQCSHDPTICRQCLATYITNQIDEHGIQRILCPLGCSGQITGQEITQFTPSGDLIPRILQRTKSETAQSGPKKNPLQGVPHLFQGNYEFRETFLNHLSTDEIAKFIYASEVHLSPEEQKKYLDPFSEILRNNEALQSYVDAGHSVTLIGEDLQYLQQRWESPHEYAALVPHDKELKLTVVVSESQNIPIEPENYSHIPLDLQVYDFSSTEPYSHGATRATVYTLSTRGSSQTLKMEPRRIDSPLRWYRRTQVTIADNRPLHGQNRSKLFYANLHDERPMVRQSLPLKRVKASWVELTEEQNEARGWQGRSAKRWESSRHSVNCSWGGLSVTIIDKFMWSQGEGWREVPGERNVRAYLVPT